MLVTLKQYAQKLGKNINQVRGFNDRGRFKTAVKKWNEELEREIWYIDEGEEYPVINYFITLKQYAQKHDKKEYQIRYLAKNGKLNTAIKILDSKSKRKIWFIDAREKYPDCTNFSHFTLENRKELERVDKKTHEENNGKLKIIIAFTVASSKSVSSYYREKKRGKVKTKEKGTIYVAKIAQKKYIIKLKSKPHKLKINQDENLRKFIEQWLYREKFKFGLPGTSPDQLIGELNKNGWIGEINVQGGKIRLAKFTITICKSTLYNYIYRGGIFKNITFEDLERRGTKPKRRRKRIK